MTVTSPSPAAPASRSTPLPARDRTVIGVLLVAAFVMVLNETIMSVAIPVLVWQLHITPSTGQWLSTAFLLTMAVVIPVSGFLIQRMTTRRLFLTAMTLFSVGTLTAALAPGFGVLVVARVVQGCGTAVMIPLLMTTVIRLVPVASRGRMMGNISIVISVAPALGPTISGVVLDLLGWRWLFWVVLPVALVALLIGARMMTDVGETNRVPIDLLSIPLAAIGFGGLVDGLSAVGAAASGGSSSPASVAVPVGAGVVALILFLLRQRALQRTDTALLDLRAFSSRIFSASVLAGALAFLALLGTTILLPLYLQNVLHATPLTTGLLVLPGGVVMGLLGPVVGRLYDRFGPRALLVPGGLLATGAMVLLGTVTATTPIWFVLMAHVLLSIALANVLTPLFTAGLGAVPMRYTAYGSAIFATVQQVGGAAGTALAVTLMAIGSASARAGGASVADAGAAGSRIAFLVGAGVLVVATAVSLFVTKPVAETEAESLPADAVPA